MTRARGMTIVEVMVATALAGILSGSLLMMVRSQLIAYETNDQVDRAQQNARVAIDLLESMGRRACGGLAVGSVGLNVGTPSVQPCLRFYDGAVQAGGTFINATPTGAADAVELIFASSPFSKLVGAPSLSATPPTAAVADVSNFHALDYVIIGDMQTGVLLQIATGGVATTGTGGPPTAGTLTFVVPGGTLAVPSNPALNLASTSLYVMKAQSFALYVETTKSAYANMLMLDPDGMLGTDHLDAQPLADGVIDLQVAVGIDGTDLDGVLQENPGGAGDDWYGNASGETIPAPPWNRAGTSDPQLRQLRITTVVRTLNQYPGVAPTLGPFEDRSTYPATATGGGPRYRSERVVIAPRVWNLLN
jgi:prepilin-type N-terminal cleavage/methylation domain-containing protein